MLEEPLQDRPVAAGERGRQPRFFYGYWLIGAAFVAQFVAVGAIVYVMGPFLAPMTEELGWTRAKYTIPRSLGQFLMAVTGFVIGTHVDRYGARRLMLIGITLLAGSLFAMGSIDTLWQWIVLNGILATVGAGLMGNLVVNVTLAKWFVELRGRAIAFSAMGVSFAGVLLTPTMTMVIDTWGWRTGWHVLGVGAALLAYPVALVMRRAPEDHGLHPDGKSDAQVAAGLARRARLDYASSLTRSQALRTGAFYLLVFAFALSLVNLSVVILHAIPFMTDAGYPRTTAALTFTLASVPALLSKPLWGYFIDKLDPKPLAALSSALTGVSLLIILMSVRAGADAIVYVGFLLLGCGWGGMIPLQEVIWASFFGRRYLGSVRSAALPFSLILGAGAPLAASYYFDYVGDYDGAFLAIAGLTLLAAVLLLLISPPERQVTQSEELASRSASSA